MFQKQSTLNIFIPTKVNKVKPILSTSSSCNGFAISFPAWKYDEEHNWRKDSSRNNFTMALLSKKRQNQNILGLVKAGKDLKWDWAWKGWRKEWGVSYDIFTFSYANSWWKILRKEARVTFKDQNYLLFLFSFFLFLPFFNFFKLFFSVPAGKCL